MKKFLSILLVLGMLTALVSCSSGTQNAGKDTTDKVPSATDTQKPETDATGSSSPIDAIPLDNILYLFEDMNEELQFSLQHESLNTEDAGYTMGYPDFSGKYEEAMGLIPMMEPSGFVLVVFRLAEDADAAAFAADLEANANPNKWICVTADKVITRVSGRTVLFVMCMNDLAQPITDSFTEMTKEGFVPEDHMMNPLADKTMQDLYDGLYEIFSLEQYGFMDNTDLTALTADTAYGLSALDLSKIEASIFDEGFMPADEEDSDRAYLFSIIELKNGESAEAFAESVKANLDTSALRGGAAERMVAYGKNFVIIYAGSGTYSYSANALVNILSIQYRLNATVLENN